MRRREGARSPSVKARGKERGVRKTHLLLEKGDDDEEDAVDAEVDAVADPGDGLGRGEGGEENGCDAQRQRAMSFLVRSAGEGEGH